MYDPGCFVIGTKITMADGSLKNIEDVKVGDFVKTFNHETGKYEATTVFYTFASNIARKPFTLHFDNGETLSIVDVHDLFEKESLKYVRISSNNAVKFVGNHYYNSNDNKYVKLVDVTFDNDPMKYYSIYTAYNENCIANGMLSVPDDVDYELNIYKFNDELKADLDMLSEDFKNYGVYEDNCYSKKDYDEQRIKYVNIIVGKGLSTLDYFLKMRNDYLFN